LSAFDTISQFIDWMSQYGVSDHVELRRFLLRYRVEATDADTLFLCTCRLGGLSLSGLMRWLVTQFYCAGK
jgi:hypothetical protein